MNLDSSMSPTLGVLRKFPYLGQQFDFLLQHLMIPPAYGLLGLICGKKIWSLKVMWALSLKSFRKWTSYIVNLPLVKTHVKTKVVVGALFHFKSRKFQIKTHRNVHSLAATYLPSNQSSGTIVKTLWFQAGHIPIPTLNPSQFVDICAAHHHRLSQHWHSDSLHRHRRSQCHSVIWLAKKLRHSFASRVYEMNVLLFGTRIYIFSKMSEMVLEILFSLV